MSDNTIEGFTPVFFYLLREDKEPLYLGADAKDVQLVLEFEDADEPVLDEGDTVGSDLNLGDYQELAAMANHLVGPPRLKLLYPQNIAIHSNTETLDSDWSLPSTPPRGVTRSMTREAENAVQLEPESKPEPVGVANRPRQVIRRLALVYSDFIHCAPAAICTSRL
ncbi:hypothetical protein BGZ93_003655 [Podila epicladia]|nr:hypothetical protein BGZ93_003655 [Podila epicladia]